MWIVLIAGLTSLVAVSAAPFLDCRADVAFVLDGSASVGQQNWDLMLTFIRDFATLSTFGSDKTLIGVISFADEATVDIKLDDHKTSASFIGALRSVTYKDSGTNTAAALRVARTRLFNSSAGARDVAPNVLILVTDGQPTVDTDQTFPEVALTHEAGISIFVVGIGRDLSRKELVKLANNESDRVLMADDFQELIRMVNMVLSTACEIATSTVRPPSTVTTARIRAESTTTTGITPDGVATPTSSPVVSSTLTPDSTPTTTPVVSPTPTPAPVVSPTPIPVVSPTPSPVVSPTPSPVVSPTPSPVVSPTPSPVVSPTPSPAVSPTPSPAVSPTPSPAVSPTPSPAVSPTQTPGPTAVPAPTTPGTNPESRIPCDKTDLVLLLDSSGSLNSQGNWNRIKEVASIIATSLWLDQVHTQVGVVVFSSEAFLTVQLGTVDDKTQLVSVIDSVPWTSQMTNISGALRLARTKMFNTNYDRKDAENVILLITDGRSNRGITTTITEAEKLKNQGVVIYVVGLGGQVNLKELRGVSSEPSSSFLIAVPKVEELTSNTEAIFKRTCLEPRSLIAQQPVAGSCPYDVVFVMHDVTGSNATFRDMIDIVRDLAYQVDLDTHRIGLVAQSGQDVIRFYPTEFVRRDDVLALLDTLNPIGPSTKPAETFVEGLSMLAQAKDTEEPALKIIMLLLPGGIDPSEIQSIEEQAQTAKDAGVIIYVFYAAMAREELVWVASRPSQMFLLPHILPQDTINVCMTHQPGTLGCDFEDANKQSTFCGMAQSTDDDFDWTIQSGSTASLHTGPDSDVTGAFYIYLEASAPRKLGDVAEIALPRVTWSGASCLSFFYHMMGWHVGQLQVVLQTRVAQEERIVWVLGGHQSEEWRLGMVTVTITDKDQLLLRGIRGGAFSGDISLDHIRLSTGACAASTASFVGLAIP